ncbi:hypothetical protein NG798_02550 [Ancylothrix sp. C2]|uniref:hypothetical protein n=1 Tax=Ancylothrix sp. D3o TaxID=2953691 RepID=UPI0021BB322B|nr:hypothetical protein [Ancylothrix sp. D3o]MCT7948660.1 hypothetical protein [Ancylothrix sp. D3o]
MATNVTTTIDPLTGAPLATETEVITTEPIVKTEVITSEPIVKTEVITTEPIVETETTTTEPIVETEANTSDIIVQPEVPTNDLIFQTQAIDNINPDGSTPTGEMTITSTAAEMQAGSGMKGGSGSGMKGGSGSGMKGGSGKIKIDTGKPNKANNDYAITCEQPKVKYCRENYSELLVEFYGVGSVEELSDSQIIEYLQGEGRFTTVIGLLDVTLYKLSNIDLQEAGLTDEQLVEHFVNHGQFEERTFSLVVNLDIYRLLNKDLSGMTSDKALEHLMKNGVKEGRPLSPFIDLQFYVKENKDLAGMTNEQALQHLLNHGFAENRRFSQICDINFYRENHSDLGSMSAQEALIHLVKYGLEEERQFSAFINLTHYRKVHADLSGMTAFEALHHFMEYGLKEARSFSPLIDFKAYIQTNAQTLLSVFNVESIESLDLAKVFEFMTGAGLQQGISPSTIVSIDFFTGGTGTDTMTGGTGTDTMTGDSGSMTGDSGSMTSDSGSMTSDSGSMTSDSGSMTSDSGTDDTGTDDGGTDDIGTDTLPGGGGTDTLPGGGGTDTLPGGGGTDTLPGGGDGEPIPPVSQATPYINIGFVISANLEILKAQFPTLDLENPENLTQEQLDQIQAYAEEEELNPAPFVDVSHIESKLTDNGIRAKLIEAGFTEAEIESFTSEQASEALLQIGESPSRLISFDFLLKQNPELETKFTVNGTVDYKALFEFVNQEGAKEGYSLSAFFKPSGFKAKHSKELADHLSGKFGVTVDSLKDSAKVSDKQVLDAADDSEGRIVNIEYGFYKYAVQLAQFYQTELALQESELTLSNSANLVVKIKAAITAGTLDIAAIEKFMLVSASDKEFGTCEVNFKGLIKDETIKLKLKAHFFGSETVADTELEGLSEKQIKEFLSDKAFELKLDLSQYVDVGFFKAQYAVQLKNFFKLDDTTLASFDANKIARFFLDESSVDIDQNWITKKYGEQTTAEGKKIKDLDDKELKLYALGEGFGTIKLSGFKLDDIKVKLSSDANYATLKTELLAAYGATALEEVTDGQITAFIKGNGLKKGLVKKVEDFLDAEVITELKTLYKNELAAAFGIDLTTNPTGVDTLSASLVFDFKHGGFSEYLDLDFFKEFAKTSSLLNTAGVAVATLTDAELLNYVYTELVNQADFSVDKLSAIKVEAFIAVQANADALKEFFGVEDVSTIDVKAVQDFILTEAKELGLTVDASVIDVQYMRATFAAAIAASLNLTAEQVATDTTAVTDQQIIDWCGTNSAKVDTDYISSQIEGWIEGGQLTAAEVAGFLAVDAATFDITKLTEKQIIDLSFKAEFKTLLETKTLELDTSAIDIDAFIEANAIKLADYYIALEAEGTDDGADDGVDDGTDDGADDGLDDGTDDGVDDGLDDGTDDGVDDGLDDGTGTPMTDEEKIAFAKTLSVQQVIDYMGHAWVTEGLDVTEFVNVDYLRAEFAVDLAKHFDVSIDIVKDTTQFTDELVLDFTLGGLSKYIDKEYLEETKSITGEADWQIIKVAYDQDLKAADVSTFDVETYSKTFLKEIAEALKIPYGQLKKLDKEEIAKIQEFAFSEEGLQLAENEAVLETTYKTDYFRNQEEVAANFNAENAYTDKPEATQEYMAQAAEEGLETSEVIDQEWYRTTYADDLETNQATIDKNGDAQIDEAELNDYITGEGLEKGNNPSQAVDFQKYRTDYAQDLLTEYSATSIDQVTYEQTLNFMMTTGIEKGYSTSTKIMDLAQYEQQYGAEMAKQLGVQVGTDFSYQQTYEFSLTIGVQIGINPYTTPTV